VVAFLAGCPSLTVEQIELESDSVTSESFTLSATVRVVEEDPAVDDDGNLGGGRGVLGVWLPPSWEVTGARAMGPQDTELVDLTPLDDDDGHFPPPFPYVEGEWFAFVSECENLEAGTFDYEIEIDVLGDGSQTEVTLGVSTALFDEQGSNGAPPDEVRVDLEAATAEVRPAPQAPAPAGLATCESIPYADVGGDDGCSCSSAGVSRAQTRPSLLELIARAL
jgi:hypothetical protein